MPRLLPTAPEPPPVPVEAPASRLRPLAGRAPGTLVVHEIYRSLQGESIYAGLPCVFVRLTACHLRCSYCDTPHAFQSGQVMPIDAVLGRALGFGDQLVEITGGEPLLQAEVFPLMTGLADAGRTVLLETSGAIAIEPVDPRVHLILDVKTPGSGELAANLESNLGLLKASDEVKYVVCDRKDFDWAVAHILDRRLDRRAALLVSAAFGRVDPTDLAGWVLESGLPLRLQLPLHKRLWDPQARGV